MNTGRFLRISNGDYLRPESVVAVTARDKEDRNNPAMVTVFFKRDHRLYIECESFEEALDMRGEIMDAINNHFVDRRG